jgi:DNA-binding NtrC family response regulator
MSKRLLILIDGEPVTTRALALDLTEAGYRVETAEDGREAIRRSRLVPFDLLIAAEDREGGRSARRVLDSFRRVRPAAKVVLMTTEGGRDSLSGEESDRVTRVRKPFDLETIRALVERLLTPEGTASGNAT